MSSLAIIGGQWGDEGKGKVVDFLAQRAQMVVRFSGGSNAGHTVVNPLGEFRMHLVPSGIFYPQVTGIIGSGVVVDPRVLLEEITELKRSGVDTSRLFISDRAHLVMPYHYLLDGLEEGARGAGALGTTRRGIGPAYVDKAARLGIRCGDLLDGEAFKGQLHFVLEQKNALLTRLYNAPPLSGEEVFNQYQQYTQQLAPYIRETEPLIEEALDQGQVVLLEGAQGTLLDLDFGTYPFVTSSSPVAAGACLGSGLSPRRLDQILGVFKAYPTRVGRGPMPTEMEAEAQEVVRERAREYGATTGRPRRCGWFDGVAARYACRLNGFTALALTRLDVLDVLPWLKICIGYEVDGKRLDRFPSSAALLERCQPIYEELPGWLSSTQQARRFEDLPSPAQDYARRIEELTACPLALISVGSKREETVTLNSLI